MEQQPVEADAEMSTRLLMRLAIGAIALWSLVSGLVLTAFHGASSGALGAGVSDLAGQRLVGVHLLLLVPVYMLLILRYERMRSLLWLPFCAQLAVFLSVGYSILDSDTSFGDGILALAVSALLGGLYGFIWFTEQRAISLLQFNRGESGASGEAAPADEQ